MKNEKVNSENIYKYSENYISLLVLGILFFLPIYLVKIKFYWVSFNALDLSISILFLIWIFEKYTKYQIMNIRYQLPVFFIFIGLFLSLIVNKNYYSGFGVIKSWFALPIIFGLIFYDQLKENRNLLKKSLFALFFSGLLVSVIGIVYRFLGIMTYDGRLKIFWDSPNQLAMFLAVPFLIGVWLALFSIKNKVFLRLNPRIFFAISLALISANLFFTKSFGTWMGIIAVLVVMFWFEYSKNTRKKDFLIIAIVFVLFFGWISIDKFEQIRSLGSRSSLASRAMIWNSAKLMIEKNFFFGIGPGNFQEKYLEYQKYFPLYLEWSVPQPHNLFLAFWLQSGLIGLIGFIWLIILFFCDNKIAIKNSRDIGILFLGIIIYILIHGLIDTTYWRNDLAIVFWVVIVTNLYLSTEQERINL